MTEISINFSGITHDHSILEEISDEHSSERSEDFCSTIVILRRHPMYDCLVLAKKYRPCLNSYSLEFPITKSKEEREDEPDEENKSASSLTNKCGHRKLISKFVDGDDPMYQSLGLPASLLGSEGTIEGTSGHDVNKCNLAQPFMAQIQGKREDSELIHVPVNGLLDRLKSYTNSGLAVDSRVYSFAIGLKTAERILTNISLKEPQETPV